MVHLGKVHFGKVCCLFDASGICVGHVECLARFTLDMFAGDVEQFLILR